MDLQFGTDAGFEDMN